MNETNEPSTWEEALESFESEYEEVEETNEESEQFDEVETTEDEEVTEDSEQDDDPETDSEPSFENDKQNKAFQEMRQKLQQAEKQAQESSKYAQLIQKIAEQNGTTPEDIVQQYEQRQLEKEAEKQNLPVEYLQKQRELESQLNQIKQESFVKDFKGQAENLKNEHGLDDNQVLDVARWMDEKGFPTSVSLADGYFLMNKDSIIESQVKESNQKRLAEKQAKRKSAALPQGDASASKSNSNVLSDEEYENIVKELGLGR